MTTHFEIRYRTGLSMMAGGWVDEGHYTADEAQRELSGWYVESSDEPDEPVGPFASEADAADAAVQVAQDLDVLYTLRYA